MSKNSRILMMDMPDGGFLIADVDEFVNELCTKSKEWRDNLKDNMLLWFKLNDDKNAIEAINQIFEEAAKKIQ